MNKTIIPEDTPPAGFPVVKPGSPMTVAAMLEQPGRIWDLLPDGLSGLSREDAAYHYRQRRNWIDLNQVDAARNLAIHRQAIDLVGQDMPPGAVLLEMGGGVAFDAQMILERAYPLGGYLFSEISLPLLEHVAAEFPPSNGTPVVFCALDAGDLMLAAAQVDVVLMIAALHHVPDLPQALSEIDRVCKPGARIVFGIEPNSLWIKGLARLRRCFRPLFPPKSHSAADEQNEGFSMNDFYAYAGRTGWRLETLQPVWLTCGILHYGLEFLYRALRLSKRIRLPQGIENIFVRLDAWLLHVPLLKPLAWHFTVSYRKDGKEE